MSKLSSEILDEKEKLNQEKNYDSDSGDYHDYGDLQSCKPISGSFFDLTFRPTPKVTYKTILPQVLACVSAASFHLPIGLIVAYSAILLDQLEQPDSEIKIIESDGSWIASSTILVVPVAALITGILVDKIGRVNTLRAAAVPYAMGWIMIATATNLPSIIIGRVLTGFALAMGSSPAVVYITEVARPDLRGALICLGPSMTSSGMVLVYLAGCYLHWRTVAWINIGFVIMPLVMMYLFTPESPSWLVSRGRNQEALKACKVVSLDKAKVICGDCNFIFHVGAQTDILYPAPIYVSPSSRGATVGGDHSGAIKKPTALFLEFIDVAFVVFYASSVVTLVRQQKLRNNSVMDLIHQRRVKMLEREHERKASIQNVNVMSTFITAIMKPTVYKPFAILTMCFFFQQMSGIYVLILYAVTFFKDISKLNPYLLSVIVGLIRMFVGFITSQLLYKCGRRILCLSSLLSMAVLMFISGGCILMVRKGILDSEWLLVPTICLLFYICMSTMGLLSIPWTMTAEMFPLEVRGIMQGITVCVAHLLMFFVIKSYYWLRDVFGGSHGLLLFYGGVCLTGYIFIYLFLPETHKKTLDEIADYFMNNMIYVRRKKSVYDDRFPVKEVDADNPNV